MFSLSIVYQCSNSMLEPVGTPQYYVIIDSDFEMYTIQFSDVHLYKQRHGSKCSVPVRLDSLPQLHCPCCMLCIEKRQKRKFTQMFLFLHRFHKHCALTTNLQDKCGALFARRSILVYTLCFSGTFASSVYYVCLWANA